MDNLLVFVYITDGSGADWFTQDDINHGRLSYHNDGTDDSGMDFFLFMVADINQDGYLINGTRETRPAFFNILVQPLDKEPPRLAIMEKPTQLQVTCGCIIW